MVSQVTIDRIAGGLLLGLLGVLVATVALGGTDVEAKSFHKWFVELVEDQGPYMIKVVVFHVSSVLLLAGGWLLARGTRDAGCGCRGVCTG